MDSENKQSHQVKTRRFVLDKKKKCQIKRNHSSTHVSLAASAILFRKLCRLFHISSGRDGRASKSGRRPIEHTGIVLPIPAALPLAQTNRLQVMVQHKLHNERPDHILRSEYTFFVSIKSIACYVCIGLKALIYRNYYHSCNRMLDF